MFPGPIKISPPSEDRLSGQPAYTPSEKASPSSNQLPDSPHDPNIIESESSETPHDSSICPPGDSAFEPTREVLSQQVSTDRSDKTSSETSDNVLPNPPEPSITFNPIEGTEVSFNNDRDSSVVSNNISTSPMNVPSENLVDMFSNDAVEPVSNSAEDKFSIPVEYKQSHPIEERSSNTPDEIEHKNQVPQSTSENILDPPEDVLPAPSSDIFSDNPDDIFKEVADRELSEPVPSEIVPEVPLENITSRVSLYSPEIGADNESASDCINELPTNEPSPIAVDDVSFEKPDTTERPAQNSDIVSPVDGEIATVEQLDTPQAEEAT